MENKLIQTLREKIKDKKVLILGFGREGKGSLSAVERAGGYALLAISDKREIGEEEIREHFQGEILPTLISGEKYLEAVKDYDLVLKSPGIVLEQEAYKKALITSQTEIFLEVYKNQVIGITGTKGKSTTTTLIYHILKESGKEAVLLGNIGIPAFDKIDEIKEDTNIVFELSCHQLENGKVSPHIGIYLNVFPEHLDHYKTFAAYQLAKENIYKHQTKEDRLYCGSSVIPREGEYQGKLTVIYDFNRGDEKAFPQVEINRNSDFSVRKNEEPLSGFEKVLSYEEIDCNEKIKEKEKIEQRTLDTNKKEKALEINNKNALAEYLISQKEKGKLQESFIKSQTITHGEKSFTITEEEISLKGYHNLFDIAVAFAVCSDLGVNENEFLSALKTYQTLPHRLEYFGTFDGIKFFDDSISTIPATTIAALETIKDTDTILIGGMDRGIDYSPLIDYLCISKVPNIILMEYTGARIYDEIKTGNMELYNSERLILVDDLTEAVKKAKEITRKGHSCIMSPAAASYGIFKNFEERGEVFKLLVKGEN